MRTSLPPYTAAFVLAIVSGGCTGMIGEPGTTNRPGSGTPDDPLGGPSDPNDPSAPDTPGAPGAPGTATERPPAGPFVPAAATLRRLTTTQYRNTVRDLLGASVRIPTLSVPDPVFNGSTAIGAANTTFSPSAIESSESAARDLAAQGLATAAQRQSLAGCSPTGPGDAACARTLVTRFGRRAFRRPLGPEQVAIYAPLLTSAAMALGDFWKGAQAAVAAMLQSPNFLFRAELGEPDPADPSRRRYDGYDMAARLSYLFWNTTPDDALLDAAGRGTLTSAAGVATQAERLLAAPRARTEAANFFAELYGLNELDELAKDAAVYPRFTETLGPAMKRETLAVLDDLVFGRDADLLEVFDTRTTFVDAELATLYGLPAPAGAGLTRVTLPASSPRVGLLGQASFLAVQASATRTSPTLRGLFVREALLCQDIPAPPPNVATTLPELDASRPHTARERLEVHRSAPACAGCHTLMDPIGLAFEHFDGLGVYRTTDQGLPIETAGDLDGVAFADPRALATVLREHPAAAPCVVRKLYRYATGHVETNGERAALYELFDTFDHDGHRLKPLLLALAASDGFRYAAPPR